MAKYKRYDYKQSLMIPVSLKEQLMPGTLEFAIHTLVERRMDMSVFDDNYQNDETDRSAYDPKILLKVVLLSYSRGLISSRGPDLSYGNHQMLIDAVKKRDLNLSKRITNESLARWRAALSQDVTR